MTFEIYFYEVGAKNRQLERDSEREKEKTWKRGFGWGALLCFIISFNIFTIS